MEVKITDHVACDSATPVMFQMMDMSTMHLRATTLKDLCDQETPAISFAKKDHELGLLGVFVHVPDEFDFERDVENADEEDNNYPHDLLECMRFVVQNKAHWIMFDRDGTVYKDLPIYDEVPGPHQNTKIYYMYRDGANYKLHFDEVLVGSVDESVMQEFNRKYSECFFYPDKVGLRADTFVDKGYDAYDDDPDCHEFCWLELTYADATVDLTVEKFIAEIENGNITG